VRVAFVYPNSRARLAADVAAGHAPDTGLLGQNRLAEHGIDARIHEPRARRRHRAGGVLHRVTWNARELVLPLELRDTDVVVTPLANLLPLTARLARGPRVVLLDWGLATALARASRPRRRLLGAALGSAAAIACPSEAQRRHLVEVRGYDARRVRLVELGVDAEFFRPRPAEPADYVLAVGKDLARDYRTLFDAARRGGFRTIVVAHPRNLVGLDPPPNVEHRYGLDWSELRDLYAGAACVALPLRRADARVGTDGSGLTAVLEAMASGVPVVASRRPALETYLADGRSGVLVEPEDAEALAAAVQRVLADPAAAARLGTEARAAVEERFTTRALGERLARVLHSLGGG
jgi:glycosyltransferase involved in cell wall biosynthesis